MSNFQNGRVIDLNKKQFTAPQLFESVDGKKVQNNFEKRMMTGIYEPSTLNQVYFSKDNLNLILVGNMTKKSKDKIEDLLDKWYYLFN